MADGKHCPACGKDIGYWTVALQVTFWIRCPHCRARLDYAGTSGYSLVTGLGALLIVGVAAVPAVLVAVRVADRTDVLGGVAAGLGVLVAVAVPVGLAVQMVLALAERRNRTLVLRDQAPTPSGDAW